MATTQLKDLFIEEYYLGIEPQNSPEKSDVFQSGIVTRSSALDQIANLGQGTAQIHFWNDLDADEGPNISTDDPDQIGAVGKVTQSSMTARVSFLNKAYGVMDLASELATSEPMQHIRNRFGTYWMRQWQRRLISTTDGIIKANIANDNSDMVIDLKGKIIGANALQDAAYTAGDAANQFTAIAVHSMVMSQMVKAQLIEYIQPASGTITIPTYLGKPIFMDDSLTDGKGNYTTLFYGEGAFGYGEGTPKEPVELERKPSGGNGGGSEVLWERKTWILQPAGFSWKGSLEQNESPTIADLALPGNWKREFDRKNVPFAAVLSGTAADGSGGGLGD